MALPTLKITDADGNNYLGIGFQGDSAYDVAVKNGFTGTVEDWLASLKGEDGPPGGVATELKGYVTFSVDQDGNLWAYTYGDNAASFEYDADTGNLYLILGDD